MATSYRRRLEALELVRAISCKRATDARLLTDAELWALADFDYEPTDAELEAIINAPTAEHGEGDV